MYYYTLFDILYAVLGLVMILAGFGLLGAHQALTTLLGILFVLVGLCIVALGLLPRKREP